MKKIVYLLYVLLFLLLASCATTNVANHYYYECVADHGFSLYSSPNTTGYSIYVEPGTPLYTKSSPGRKYQQFQVGTYAGYLYKPRFVKRSRSVFVTIPATVAIAQVITEKMVLMSVLIPAAPRKDTDINFPEPNIVNKKLSL